jgi:hypothetical protein
MKTAEEILEKVKEQLKNTILLVDPPITEHGAGALWAFRRVLNIIESEGEK